jgi:hypothetical protein
MRAPRLRAGPLHLAAIVLMQVACMSLMVWLSLQPLLERNHQ